MNEQAKGSPAKAILIVVLVVVAAGAIYFAATQASQPPAAPDVQVKTGSGVAEQPFYNPDLPKGGVPAPGEPKFNVEVELEKVKGRNVFHFAVTEEHGWAANGVYVTLAHHGLETKEGRGMVADRTLPILCDKSWLDFNSELKHTTTVGAQEFPELDDWGTSENWTATVSNYSDLTAPKPFE